MLGCANGTPGSGTETCNPIPLSVSLVSTLFCEIAPFLWEERQASLHLFLGKPSELLKLYGPSLPAIQMQQLTWWLRSTQWTSFPLLCLKLTGFLASCFIVFSPRTFHYWIVFFSLVTSQPNVHAFAFRKGAFMSGETCLRDEPLTYACPGNACNWEWFCVLTVKQPPEASPRPALLALKENSQETWPSTNADSRVRSDNTQRSFPRSRLLPVLIHYFVTDQLRNLFFQLVQNASKEKKLENECMQMHGSLPSTL